MAPPPFLKPCSAALARAPTVPCPADSPLFASVSEASAATWASTYTGCGTVRVRRLPLLT